MRFIRVYNHGIHHGEESIVCGNARSGLVNFSGCHLSCNFCYTPETSVQKKGTDYTSAQFKNLLIGLIQKKATNINLISPTLEWSAIEPALMEVRNLYRGKLPFILKISGYEGLGLIHRMAEACDIWVPDFKVYAQEQAESVNLPKNYGEVASSAILSMMARHGTPVYNDQNQLTHGIVVRHLLMPGFFEDSKRVVDCLGEMKFRGVLNFMSHFLDPKKKQIYQAPLDNIQFLRDRALGYGMTVLVNGFLEQSHAA